DEPAAGVDPGTPNDPPIHGVSKMDAYVFVRSEVAHRGHSREKVLLSVLRGPVSHGKVVIPHERNRGVRISVEGEMDVSVYYAWKKGSTAEIDDLIGRRPRDIRP